MRFTEKDFHSYWQGETRMCSAAQAAEKANEFWDERVKSLFKAIKHGDQKHQAWLRIKLKEHFATAPERNEK